MSLEFHTTHLGSGSASPAKSDGISQWSAFALANVAGGSAGASVTTAVVVPAAAGLPSNGNYFVDVELSVNATYAITAKTATGFNVVMTPVLSTATLGAGTFNVNVTY